MPTTTRRNHDLQNQQMTFAISPAQQFQRFLILGTLKAVVDVDRDWNGLVENIQDARAYIDQNPEEAINQILNVSIRGLAPKQGPTLFALAMVMTSENANIRKMGLAVGLDCLRTHSHVLEFVSFLKTQPRSWNKQAKQLVQNYYLSTPLDDLAYQLIKYKNRATFGTSDVLRLAHPKPTNTLRTMAFYWAMGKWSGLGDVETFDNVQEQAWRHTYVRTNAEREPVEVIDEIVDLSSAQSHLLALLWAAERVHKAGQVERLRLIEEWNLPREALPTEALNDPNVWSALLFQPRTGMVRMPITALIRNLPTLTRLGVLDNETYRFRVCERLTDRSVLRKGRVHPMQLVAALMTYRSGHSVKGNTVWTPHRDVVDALDRAIYLAFETVEPTGVDRYIGIDVSGSMDGGPIWGGYLMGIDGFSPRLMTAILAKAALMGEQNVAEGVTPSKVTILAFSSGVRPVEITPDMKLDRIQQILTRISADSTRVAAPIEYAMKQRERVGAIEVLTDNDVNTGDSPQAVMDRYRREYDTPTRWIVQAMKPDKNSVLDHRDPLGLEIVGCSTDSPRIAADFIAGRI